MEDNECETYLDCVAPNFHGNDLAQIKCTVNCDDEEEEEEGEIYIEADDLPGHND